MDKNVTIKFQNIRAYKLIFSINCNIIDNVKDIYVITFMGIVKCYDAMQTLYKMRLSVIKSKCSNRYSKFQREVQIGPQGGIIMDERLKQQLDFILEIDKEKNILRQTHLSGHGRRENDAEHAWHMAIMAYLLKDYANEPVDIAKVMIMCLIHDIVEIDAGDTYAYDTEGLKTQKAREDAAKERIFSLLPEDQKKELTALFDEFENYRTPESKFAHSLDNLQPLLLNNSNGGGDWREHQVTSEQVYGRQRKTQLGSETLYKVTDQILKENIERENIKES